MSGKRETKRGDDTYPSITEIDVFIVDQVLLHQDGVVFDPFVISTKLYAETGVAMSLGAVADRFFDLVNYYGSFEKLSEITNKKRVQSIPRPAELQQSNPKSEVKHTHLTEKLLTSLNQISSSPLSDIFRDPVESNIYMSFNNHYEGPYMTRVFRPMDLSSVRSHIQSGKIGSWKSLLHYLTLISTNCVFFNSPDSEFPKRAMQFFDLCCTTLNAAQHTID